MTKHLLIYSPIVQWPVHFETDLEIAQQHLDLGWKVTFLRCRGALPVCAQNTGHHRSVCRKCVSRFDQGMRWLGRDRVSVAEFQCLSEQEQGRVTALADEEFATVAMLKEFTLHGAGIGLAAYGSVVSLLREPNPDMQLHRQLITANLQAAALVYFSLRNQLERLKPDLFVLFSGRFAEVRSALMAAQELGVPTLVHERAGSLERYCVTRNTGVHDIPVIKEIIKDHEAHSKLSEAEKQRVATEWYEARWAHKEQSWYSFAAQQRPGLLPEYAPDRLNLVIFNSSEDENEGFQEMQNPFYADQNDGLRRIVADLRGDGRFKVFLRVHPNLKGVDNSQADGILRLERDFPELTVLHADSPVSTYGTLESCDLVLVFGTTVGIEAAYAGKPCFLMGRAYYEDLGCCVRPDSHGHLMRLLSEFASGSREMLPDPEAVKKGVISFGLFNKTWGETYRYVRPCHVGRSVMVRNGRETRLRPSIASWLIDKILSWARRSFRC